MNQQPHPFRPIATPVARRVLLILVCVEVLATFFLPWLQMEVIPVEGRHLPQMAAEYYGKFHTMVWFSYLIFLIPAYAIFLIWRMAYNLTPGYSRLAILPVLLAATMGAVLLYVDATDAMNLSIRYGYGLLLMGTMAMALLVWRWPVLTSETEPAP